MRAVVNAKGFVGGMTGFTDHMAACMLPVLDRPLVQHVVEKLAACGVDHMDVLVSHHPEQVEKLLGDGTRWNCSFTFHVAEQVSSPWKTLKQMSFDDDTDVILADALFYVDEFEKIAAEHDQCLLLYDEADREWTGWGKVDAGLLRDFAAMSTDDRLLDYLASRLPKVSVFCASNALNVRTYMGFLEANIKALDGEFKGLMLGGLESGEKIRISRNVMLHPASQIIPPVFIGADCRIEAGVKLGPYCVVGNGCVLDSGSILQRSVVMDKSYVGQGLELCDVAVDRSRLINCRLGGVMYITDRFLIGDLNEQGVRGSFYKLVNRMAACVLYVAFLPFILLSRVKCAGRKRVVLNVVKLPAPDVAECWQTIPLSMWRIEKNKRFTIFFSAPYQDFLFRFIPGLKAVIKGKLNLVGVEPRTREQIKLLPDDWRELYLQAPAGLVSESYLIYGAEPDCDDLFASESFYTVKRSWWYDTQLLIRYFYRVLMGLCGFAKDQKDVGYEA